VFGWIIGSGLKEGPSPSVRPGVRVLDLVLAQQAGVGAESSTVFGWEHHRVGPQGGPSI